MPPGLARSCLRIRFFRGIFGVPAVGEMGFWEASVWGSDMRVPTCSAADKLFASCSVESLLVVWSCPQPGGCLFAVCFCSLKGQALWAGCLMERAEPRTRCPGFLGPGARSSLGLAVSL